MNIEETPKPIRTIGGLEILVQSMNPALAESWLAGTDGPAMAARLRRKRLGLVAHPASVTSRLEFAADALLRSRFNLCALFGPQHGARGEKQDNMIESEHYADPVTGLPVHSLYSEVRKPTPAMLKGLDTILFDLQDVGTRVYTFIWTMALVMEACAEHNIQFVVLDRPNPIGLNAVEGPVVQAGYESFVGLHPLPLRHGMTVGEIALWLNAPTDTGGRGIGCPLEVVRCHGLDRNSDTAMGNRGLPWVMPSPNLPGPESCLVYPGMVLLEGTNLSEGRGTTRPFELFGAPWIDPVAFVARLNEAQLPGIVFRPCHFEPTFNKHAGQLCGGAQLYPTGPGFKPVRTAIEILVAARELAPGHLSWIDPPYEYEEILPPIDILWGSPALREGVDRGDATDTILAASTGGNREPFPARDQHLLY